MPTLNEWIDALFTDYRIEVISTPRLISEVAQLQRRRIQDFINKGKTPPPMKGNLTPVSTFYPSRTVTIKPIDLLHSIGRITTPPVPNLVDISSTWAIIRYIWAFEPTPSRSTSRLVLSTIAREIDFHQKALLSDQVGVGIANYLMINYLNMPHAIDVDIALESYNWPIDQQYRTSPDYLFFDNPSELTYVVECKGNQTSYNNALDQLRRGTEQVPSIVFNDGRQAVSIVIATCMLRDRTTVYVIDPVDRNNVEPDFEEDFQKAKRITPNKWRVVDDKWFYRDARLVSRAKMLAFAGATGEALDQLPFVIPKKRTRLISRDVAMAIKETDYGDFEGVKEDLTTIDGFKIEIYRGLLASLRRQYKESLRAKGSGKQQGQESIPIPQPYLDKFEEIGYKTHLKQLPVGAQVESICRDGTMLQINISELT